MTKDLFSSRLQQAMTLAGRRSHLEMVFANIITAHDSVLACNVFSDQQRDSIGEALIDAGKVAGEKFTAATAS